MKVSDAAREGAQHPCGRSVDYGRVNPLWGDVFKRSLRESISQCVRQDGPPFTSLLYELSALKLCNMLMKLVYGLARELC